MTTQAKKLPKEDWEEEFDKKFPNFEDSWGKIVLNMEIVKDFIRTLLAQQKKDIEHLIEQAMMDTIDVSNLKVKKAIEQVYRILDEVLCQKK